MKYQACLEILNQFQGTNFIYNFTFSYKMHIINVIYCLSLNYKTTVGFLIIVSVILVHMVHVKCIQNFFQKN